MNKRFLKNSLKLLILFLSFFLLTAPTYSPPLQSSFKRIVTNRRYISHILYELKWNRHNITILLSHGPTHHAFHAKNFPLYHDCKTPAMCIMKLKKLNSHLKTGGNLTLLLLGSRIKKIIYHKPFKLFNE